MSTSAGGLRAAAVLAAAAWVLSLASGCEMDSTSQRIEIKPGGVSLAVGQSQTFRVSGGSEYAWTLEPDDGHGMLSARQGDAVVFTLLSATTGEDGGETVIAVHCTSTIPGVSGTGTNAAYVATDTAYVHIAR